MVNNCVAYGCSNVFDKSGKVQFHSFPFKRPEIVNKWVAAIRRDNWLPTKHSRLCSAHFLTTDYSNPNEGKKKLKQDSVPSLFSFPIHLQKKIKPRRIIVRHRDVLLESKPGTSKMTTVATETEEHDSNMVKGSCWNEKCTQTSPKLSPKKIKLQRRIKNLKEKLRRRNKKITSMNEIIGELKEKGHSTENLNMVLENYFSGFPLDLLVSQLRNSVKPKQRRYSQPMKEFALTLYFYSPKAYNFVRSKFYLPNGRTIRNWLSTFNCNPGFLEEVFEFLKQETIRKPAIKDCSLTFDSMAIRKQVSWDKTAGKFSGYTDYGGIVDVDPENPATEALMLQMVSYKNNFKCPVAYFFTNKLNSDIQSKLVLCCLRKLFEVGITVRSITCDGAAANIQTFKALGCKISANELMSSFKHPSCDSYVHCMLDSCHMIKLARNVLAEKVMVTPEGIISWEYLTRLNNLQEGECFKMANSLTSRHIKFKNKIMNVGLAVQSLSSGVADAIDFLRETKVQDFQGSEATTKYIRMVDRLFDILNSRNPFGKGFKAPIKSNSLEKFRQIFEETEIYLRSIHIDGIPLLEHPRKTFALGFILTMKSTLNLAANLFDLPNQFNYLLTYKCSQDHIELFFSCIRSRGGWNNNPNTLQFKWSLRQLLYKNQVACSVNANCLDLGGSCTPVFEFRSEIRQIIELPDENCDVGDFSDLFLLIDNRNLSEFQERVLYYIAGFIVRKLTKTVLCLHCKDILLHTNNNSDHSYACSADYFKTFCNFVTRGGLIFASDIVFFIVQYAEKVFQLYINSNLMGKANVKQLITNLVVIHFSTKINLFKPNHPPSEYIFEDVHEIQLTKKIVYNYLNCRMAAHGKQLTQKLQGNTASARHKLTKLILFQNL